MFSFFILGLPETVVSKARVILESLKDSQRNSDQSFRALEEERQGMEPKAVIDSNHPVIERLESTLVDMLTPREAMNLIWELKPFYDTDCNSNPFTYPKQNQSKLLTIRSPLK